MTSIPSHLQMGLKPSIPRVRSEVVSFAAMNSSYAGTLNNTIRIDVPALPAFLDPLYSFLSFTITCTTGAGAAVLDDSAAAIFNSLAVYSGGQQVLLEQVNSYNLLHGILFALTSSPNDAAYAWSVCSGTTSTVRTGQSFAAGGSTSASFAIPLASILGLNSTKMLPMDAGFTILLGLESPTVAFQSANACTYTVSDVNYFGSVHYLPNEVSQAIKMSTGPQLIVPTQTWRNFSATLTASTQNSAQFGIRASSLKNILSCLRESSIINTQAAFSLSDLIRANVNSYQTLIGSSYTPLRPLTTTSQMWAETCKSMHFWGTQNASKIGIAAYNANTSGGTGINKAGFVIGTDYESMSRNKSDTVLGGVSTLGVNNLQIQLGHSTAPVVTQLDSFMHIDAVLMFSGNQVTVQF
jgi:hypothetical protein